MPAGDRVRIESLHVSWPGSFFLVVVGIFGKVVVLGKHLSFYKLTFTDRRIRNMPCGARVKMVTTQKRIVLVDSAGEYILKR